MELGSRLFRIQRIFAVRDDDHRDARIVAMAVHSLERRQLLALAVSSASAPSDDPRAHYLIVRSIEEDRRVRHWRLPLAASHAKQQQQRVEPLAALVFSPDGDWLACLSTRKNRLHLVPVAALIAGHRRSQLARAYQPPHNREWMSVAPSVMTTPMASYLRATNEAGGLNGARYNSRVAGDDSQMSTLEFAVGMGTVTCCCWWRSMNGKNYCLVGGSDNIISIVNVEDNAEECRCELQNAGAIESIELFHESFRKEKRTSMLVKTRVRESGEGSREPRPDAGETSADGFTTKYYRVVLEKKTLQKQKQSDPESSAAGAMGSTSGETGDVSQVSESESLPRLGSRPAVAELFVVRTFPDHFVEDMDFRPQRIKKNKPKVRLCAINGLLSSESGLAMLDAATHKISVYSNFQWSLKGQYALPTLLSGDESLAHNDRTTDIDIAYCSSDLMLLRAKSALTGKHISTWVSLPSRQAYEEVQDRADDEAHVVHYLSLHDGERVECVLQARYIETDGPPPAQDPSPEFSGAMVGDVIYIIQTAHNVYECRPQWSRVALFRALRGRTIDLRDALSIGYALGIDMASLCEVVADTLCDELQRTCATNTGWKEAVSDRDEGLLQWLFEVYQVSRALPSKAIDQLTRVGGLSLAIEYAKRMLNKASSDTGGVESSEESSGFGGDKRERSRVSLQVVDLILHQQVQHNYNASSIEDATLRPRDVSIQRGLEENEGWLAQFVETPEVLADFETEPMVELCLSHHKIDKAVAVAITRKAVPFLLRRLIERGEAPILSLPSSTGAVESLLGGGFAPQLLSPDYRLILRSFSVDSQLKMLLASSPESILSHRDWVLRHVAAFPKEQCIRLASMVDPVNNTDLTRTVNGNVAQRSSDVSLSELTEPQSTERVELFLTLLLRINQSDSEGFHDGDHAPDSVCPMPTRFTQASLETVLRDLADQYRPPIMITRCVDYENWSAAACLHEAHGELVDAVECRLHSHQHLIHKRGKDQRRRHTAKESLVEDEEVDEEISDYQEERDTVPSGTAAAPSSYDVGSPAVAADQLASVRKELLWMLDGLVLNAPNPARSVLRLRSHAAITDTTRAAILARLLVKWFEYGLSRADLELFLIDTAVFSRVADPLSRIFFSEIIERVGGKGLHPSTMLSLQKNDAPGGIGFDERDKAWVQRCHSLPFSGQFLFHVCTWLLEQQTGLPTASSHKPQLAPADLLGVVKENIEKNDLGIRAVRIEPQSAQALGKSDPLETHVKAFSCGHVFPKRIFDEDVLPEFEKRMNALPLPLFATKQLLLSEFKRSHVEAPCPVCSFNKVSAAVFQDGQLKTTKSDAMYREPQQTQAHVAAMDRMSCYFLHRTTVALSAFASAPANGSVQQQLQKQQHEDWEWRTSTTL